MPENHEEVLFDGKPLAFHGYCVECGADVLEGETTCRGEHELRPNSVGYCHNCGRNSLSCECFMSLDEESD